MASIALLAALERLGAGCRSSLGTAVGARGGGAGAGRRAAAGRTVGQDCLHHGRPRLHGRQPGTGEWSFQRSEEIVGGVPTEMIEDLGNVDQMTFLADYLFRAGATVVPMRPIGHQTNEIVMDNDDPGVTFVNAGAWTNSIAGIFYGSARRRSVQVRDHVCDGDGVRALPAEHVAEAGFYPVYAWTRSGSDRATDQLYRVNHSGGITEVTVNHRRVGNGLVYLGTYYFEAGNSGYVDISNRSNSPGSVVIADMIRFGNGMGDINRGDGVSTLPREDEAACIGSNGTSPARKASAPPSIGAPASTIAMLRSLYRRDIRST